MTTSASPELTSLPKNDDLKEVRSVLEVLASDGRVDDLIALVMELLSEARNDNTRLRVRLAKALRMIFGRKSEKVTSAQLLLMFETLKNELSPPCEEPKGNVAQPPAPPLKTKRGGRGGKKPFPPELVREPREVAVPPEERPCPQCGQERASCGHILHEILEFVPAHFKVIEEQREQLRCENPACEGSRVVAESEGPMNEGRAGASLLAHIVVSKCQDAMPLYRQAQAYKRVGVELSPSTLGDWCGFALDLLAPVAKRIAARVLGALVIGADDTGLRVLDTEHVNNVKLGHMFAYVDVRARLVAFDYTPDWSSDGPEKFLENYLGFVQCDAYKGFGAKRENGKGYVVERERLLGCAMHIRRKFEAAAKLGDARGAIALAYFKRIYQVEEECGELRADPDARHAKRLAESLPIVHELYVWIHALKPRLIPDTPISDAVRYAVNQEEFFLRCFDSGLFEIDNGEVERQFRRVALGRKNYLFAGSDKGAERLAVAYTLLGSCHMHDVNPLEYIRDVIEKIQGGWPMARLDELTPDVWKRARAGPLPLATAAE